MKPLVIPAQAGIHAWKYGWTPAYDRRKSLWDAGVTEYESVIHILFRSNE